MLTEKEKLELITQITMDINEVKDLDILLERILRRVRRFFNADAGSIYLREKDQLRFRHTQNATLQRRLPPNEKLIYSTFSIPINNQSISGYVAGNNEVVNIPDVYAIPSSAPFTFDPQFDKLSKYRTSSMLAVPITNQKGDVLGVLQVINSMDDDGNVVPFSKADEPLIRHFATSAALAVERAQMTRNIILRMISMAELRDPTETGAHVNRVAAYSVELYERWTLGKHLNREEVEREMDILRIAAMLHDVGKIAVSDLILKKPGRLTAEEFEVIKTHTYLGAKLFADYQSDFDERAAEVALNHHEHWDGTGYPGHIDPVTQKPLLGFEGPDGNPLPKRGEEIPLFGRIVAVADVYDALRSKRAYKEPWEEERVLDEMHRLSGSHFDPEIAEAFFSSFSVLKSIAEQYPD
jgi:HD-GYP domain-containing protein (c-di-GMP phosphodiesterase class II)